MSIEIPKNIHGINPQNLKTTPAFDAVIKPQTIVPQKINREPVDYSSLARSESVQNSHTIQFNDKDITDIVRIALGQQQKPSPSGLSSKADTNTLQAGIIQNLKQNDYPIPKALR
jgi:hypothetical protein